VPVPAPPVLLPERLKVLPVPGSVNVPLPLPVTVPPVLLTEIVIVLPVPGSVNVPVPVPPVLLPERVKVLPVPGRIENVLEPENVGSGNVGTGVNVKVGSNVKVGGLGGITIVTEVEGTSVQGNPNVLLPGTEIVTVVSPVPD
jgi:hypothetical protein